MYLIAFSRKKAKTHVRLLKNNRKNDIDTCIELEGILLLDTCIDSAPNVLIAVHDRDRSKVARKVSALKPPLTRGPKKKEEREKRL